MLEKLYLYVNTYYCLEDSFALLENLVKQSEGRSHRRHFETLKSQKRTSSESRQK